ncbi:aspartate/glutamate racemase family protein [Gallaecimonas xiamenensis]|uniref:Aspartate racemase n=1 Tax=Gallaecimonas xiamenensis 3-C-1 TaxID=745411 RepID=K2J3K2_9GAMM|nr:amino acid racemase [Gallaecimonas xiamenensis]EKE69472.1 aspartate racemase [Gallaecimonas xiamenensis 3-C-1]
MTQPNHGPLPIGILAISGEGAALCYRTLVTEGAELLGPHAHPEIALHCFSMSQYMGPLEAGDWDSVAALMKGSADKLVAMGARLLICPDNTVHPAVEKLRPQSPVPWLHIAEVVAQEAKAKGYRRLGILGTRFLMEGQVYPKALGAQGLEAQIPNSDQRQGIHQRIFDELVYGRFEAASRRYFQDVIESLAAGGCDAVVLGCTEIPLLISQADSVLPVLDSTRLLARAALRAAVTN